MRLLIIGLLLLCSTLADASDQAREGRIREQIEDGLFVGRPITLKTAGNQRFLAIFTDADAPETVGGVILLHGMGADPNRATVIRPLRIGLPDHGWATLSLQMPVAPADAPASAWRKLIPEAAPRIDSAIQRLRDSGIENLVLIGHSLGAEMGLRYLAGKPPGTARAFVAIGLSADSGDPNDATLAALEKLKLPILDLFGSEDLPSVKNSARARRLAARKAGNRSYRQIRIDGADHLFHDMDEILTNRIRAWLNRVAKGSEISKP